VLGPIARHAQQLDVADVAGAAFGERQDMVDLKAAFDGDATANTLVPLEYIKVVDLLGGKGAACCQLPGSSVLSMSAIDVGVCLPSSLPLL